MAHRADMRRCPLAKVLTPLLAAAHSASGGALPFGPMLVYPRPAIGWRALQGRCAANADRSPDGGGIHPATALPYFGQALAASRLAALRAAGMSDCHWASEPVPATMRAASLGQIDLPAPRTHSSSSIAASIRRSTALSPMLRQVREQ